MSGDRADSSGAGGGPVDAWSVLDLVGEAVSVHDADGCLVYANPASRAVLADLRERMDGRPVGVVEWSAVRPDGSAVPTAELPVELVRRSGTPVDGETIGFPAADGTVRWLRITVRPLATSAPPCAVVATFADVTASVAERHQLARSAAEHRALVDGLFEGVVSQDENGSVVASNPSAAAALGLTQEQLEGRASIDPRWRAVHEDSSPWPGQTHPAMEALRTGRPQLMRTMGIHTPDGDLRWLLINSRPRLDDAGRPVGAVTSFLDVTARRAADLETAAARERLAATVEHLSEAVVLWDREGRPVLRNAATERLRERLGIAIGADGHHGAVDVLDPAGDPVPAERWPWVLARHAGTAVLREELGFRAPDGAVHWMEVTATPVDAAGGTAPFEVTMSLFDITDRRERDARLAHLADHDPLTDVLNRRGFERALARQLAYARRYGTAGGLLVIDLDQFKAVNDHHGHQAGDAVLTAVARLLRRRLRASDIVARIGGDEFAVILPDADRVAVETVAASLPSFFADRRGTDDGIPFEITASVGHVCFDGLEDAETLHHLADHSMYAMKNARHERGSTGRSTRRSR